MKKCRTCLKDLPITEYYKHFSMLDGHRNICKSCTKKRVDSYRAKNIDILRKKDNEKSKDPKRKKQRRDSFNKIIIRFPKIKNVNLIVCSARRKGLLVKKPCEVCGETKVQAHHCDYDKPLDVMWLCLSHHRKWHLENKALNKED